MFVVAVTFIIVAAIIIAPFLMSFFCQLLLLLYYLSTTHNNQAPWHKSNLADTLFCVLSFFFQSENGKRHQEKVVY